ncbi:MAG TPA: methionine adenosyltransferase [Phycisphaerae bacterium]
MIRSISATAEKPRTSGVRRVSEHLFTSESVSMGHPDKVADQISDAILDSLIEKDPAVRAAVETLVTTGLVVVAGEVTAHNEAARERLCHVEDTIRETIRRIGYTEKGIGFDADSCGVIRTIHGQSADISQGVTVTGERTEQGAGDQGLMFGFACDETRAFMPMPIYLAHRLVEQLAVLRERGEIKWLRPDAKSQITVEYRDGRPQRIDTIVLSTQHTEDVVDQRTGNMAEDAKRILRDKAIRPVVDREAPGLWSDGIKFFINPTGRFVIGGPHGDSGLTGRKIIVDTYGGRGRHGGGAFSGKDPSKVDRSASYMARHIAKNVVASGLASQCEVQLAYAIGVAEPVSVLVDTFGTGEVDEARLESAVRDLFPLTPRGIIEDLKLQRPIYFETARHGHFGREGPGFTWEATHRAAALKSALA